MPGRPAGELRLTPPTPLWRPTRDIARRAGLSLEETRAAVHALLHTEAKILHEVPDTGPTDLGPVYELAPRT